MFPRLAGSLLMVGLLLSACAQEATLKPRHADFSSLPGWELDDHAEALKSFRLSCEKMMQKSGDAVIGNGILAGPASVWREICQVALHTPSPHARAFFEAHFVPFLPENPQPGLFTGYYEPVLMGSRTRQKGYDTPVYRLPRDVKNGVKYHTRAAINSGKLKNKKLEILWVNDPVALFFAHIQGSTKVQLTDGSTTRLGYAGKNNCAYVPLGKVLKDMGAIEEVNMFTIREWLYANPAQAQAVMEKNPSYVFFKELPDRGGPIGAQGVELTAERSLAIDPAFIPYGMPLFVMTRLPETKLTPERVYNQTVIAQDTGGAIKGPVRGDIFFGGGPRAEALAGMMKGRGTYALLVPAKLAQGL